MCKYFSHCLRCPKEYFFESSQVSPAFDSVKKSVQTKTSMEHCGNEVHRKIWKYGRKNCLNVILSTKSLTMTVPRSNPGLRDLKTKIRLNYICLLRSSKSYWRNIAICNIYIMNLQTIMIHIGPLLIDHKVKKKDSKKFAGLVPTSMTQVLAPGCGNWLG
jgi:hypothetical protein